MVSVYTKPDCPACKLTKDVLEKEGIEYEVKSLMDEPEVQDIASKMGIKAAPVVRAPSPSGEGIYQWWGGFRPDRLKALAAA